MKYIVKDNYGREKEVSKKHFTKIDTMDDSVKMFFMSCNDFDLNKLYKVQDFEVKFKGIDLLVMMDKIKKEAQKPINKYKYIHPFYYDNGKFIGYAGVNGFNYCV